MEQAANDAEQAAQGVIVHILSPSPDLPHKLTLPTLDKKTTLKDLKLKIQEAVSSRPDPARQRLIYRARPLGQDEMTLEDIFGRLEVHNPDGFTLHLVLPPSPTAVGQTPSRAGVAGTDARLSSSTPPPPRPASTGQILPEMAARPHILTGSINVSQQQRTNAASMHNPTLRMGQLPPEMRQAMGFHFASLGGPMPPQLGAPGPLPLAGNAAWQTHPPFHPRMHLPAPQPPQPPMLPQQFAHMIAHQQQLRAAMGAHGAGDPSVASNSSSVSGVNTSDGQQQLHAPLGAQPTLPNNGTTTHTIVQEGHAPNGAHWRMVINGPGAQIPTVNFGNQGSAQLPASTPSHVPGSSLPNSNLSDPSTTATGIPRPSSTPASSSWQISAQDLIHRMAQLEASMANGIFISEDAIWQLQLSFHNYLREQPALQGQLENPITMRYTELMSRISRSRPGAQSRNFVPLQNPPIHPTIANPSAPRASSAVATATSVYLLSSPQGPQALVVSPQGRYVTPGLMPSGLSTQRAAPGQPNVNLAQNPTLNLPNPANDARRVVQVINHNNPGPAQEAQPDAARDLVRILLPLGGHLWLLLRLFGFVWFFMGGADWRRTLLVMLAATIVFLTQTAAFRPLVQAIWEPIRRHVEGLVPLANENPANHPGGENLRVEVRGDGGAALERPRRGDLRPEDLAARLQRERNERDQSLLWRSLRRAERATALFVASLVPGVGERHIAVREAAEAARLAAEREREEESERAEYQDAVSEMPAAEPRDEPEQPPVIEI